MGKSNRSSSVRFQPRASARLISSWLRRRGGFLLLGAILGACLFAFSDTLAQLAALPPDFQALLRAVIDYYERRIAELESKLNKSPQNSSLPPSTQHPHAKPPTQQAEVEEEARRTAGSRETRATAVAHRRVRRSPSPEADRVPSLRHETRRL